MVGQTQVNGTSIQREKSACSAYNVWPVHCFFVHLFQCFVVPRF